MTTAAEGPRYGMGVNGEVFVNAVGGPMRRTLFRTRVWLRTLVRAGLLGKIVKIDDDTYEGAWIGSDGNAHRLRFDREAEAVTEVA
ncbi:MAG: hypothetical protein ACRDVZ_06235 [Jiangellaceae bacterium]